MFTGLIESVGEITSVQQSSAGSRITVKSSVIVQGCQLGDSIAIDGVCTTVIAFDTQSFTIEASPETLAKTTFKSFKTGTKVNLERPLMPTSRLGGHYVTGHVDGLAKLTAKQQDGISWLLAFDILDESLADMVVAKGSIAINGISLTVNWVEGVRFGVAIIPHTMANTSLDQANVGSMVNIETDLLGKYVKRLLAPVLHESGASTPSKINSAFLSEHGFIPSVL